MKKSDQARDKIINVTRLTTLCRTIDNWDKIIMKRLIILALLTFFRQSETKKVRQKSQTMKLDII